MSVLSAIILQDEEDKALKIGEILDESNQIKVLGTSNDGQMGYDLYLKYITVYRTAESVSFTLPRRKRSPVSEWYPCCRKSKRHWKKNGNVSHRPDSIRRKLTDTAALSSRIGTGNV